MFLHSENYKVLSKRDYKRFTHISNKLSENLTKNDILFLRNFCKKHGYYSLYKFLKFDRIYTYYK